MSIFKKFYTAIFLSLILCSLSLLTGCGSDSSSESSGSSPTNSRSSNSSAQKVWFNPDEFIKRYNAALDRLGKRYDEMKIVSKQNEVDNCFELKVHSQGKVIDSGLPVKDNYRFSLLNSNAEAISLDNVNYQEIAYITYSSLQPADPSNKAVLLATLSTFPELKNLNYDEMSEYLSMTGMFNKEENGLKINIHSPTDRDPTDRNGYFGFSVENLALTAEVRAEQERQRAERAAQREAEEARQQAERARQQEIYAKQRAAEEERQRKEKEILAERQARLSSYAVGGINLRMHVDEIRQVLGNEKEIRESQNTPGNSYYEYDDVVICMNNGEVISVATYTNAPQTEKGLRQGDSLSRVLSTYGRVCSTTDFEDTILYEYPFEFKQGKFAIMRFAVKNNAVEYISLRQVSGEEFQEISSRQHSIWK